MKTVIFEQTGGPEVLQVVDRSTGTAGPGEVKLRMTALALNRANTLWREGRYLFPTEVPARIGTEGVGIIEAIGPHVAGFEIGQRVNLLPPDHEGASGYFAQTNIVPATKLLPAPAGMDDRHAATVWVPFLTLYHG